MTTHVDPRVVVARSQLVIGQPFFGSLALRLKLTMSDYNKTMWTDGVTLGVSPEFMSKHPEAIILFAFAHEVLHCALEHPWRRGNRDADLWNIACDYVVNLLLKAAGFAVPDWCYCDPRFRGMDAESVYKCLLIEQQQKQKQQQKQGTADQGKQDQGNQGAGKSQPGSKPQAGKGEPDKGKPTAGKGQGKGSAADSDKRQIGEVRDAQTTSEATAAEKRVEWSVAVTQAANLTKTFGTAGGVSKEVIDDLNKPRVDWRAQLRRFVDASRERAYTWSTINRRTWAAGFVAPGSVPDSIHTVVWCTDTSSSVDTEALQQNRAELQAALDEGAIDRLVYIQCDTRVTHVAVFEKGEQIKLTAYGRGGTAFKPAFDWILENEPDASAIVYFTDMCTSDWSELVDPGVPVMWAAYGHPMKIRQQFDRATFGELIEL